MIAACLPVFCWRTRPGRLAADLEGPGLPPVQFHELGGDVPRVDLQRCAGVVALQHGEVGQGVDQGELVAGDEQPLGQQPLDVPQELNLLLRRRDGPGHCWPPGPIRRLVRDDPPDAAPRVGNVPVAAGDDVDVGVHHRLPGRRAVVDADVEPVGL